MFQLVISDKAKGVDLFPLALAINEVVNLPITLRSLYAPGVRVEKGKIVDANYSGPILEEVLRTGKAVKAIPNSGAYKGIPVSVAPIKVQGKTIAAVGIVDLAGTIDMPDVFGAYAEVVKQVSEER